MKIVDVLLLWLKVAIIVVSVIFLVVITDTIQEQRAAVYHEVYIINHIYADSLKALCVEPVEYYDWEETANSLNIPIDSLTIDMFFKHILHEN